MGEGGNSLEKRNIQVLGEMKERLKRIKNRKEKKEESYGGLKGNEDKSTGVEEDMAQ